MKKLLLTAVISLTCGGCVDPDLFYSLFGEMGEVGDGGMLPPRGDSATTPRQDSGLLMPPSEWVETFELKDFIGENVYSSVTSKATWYSSAANKKSVKELNNWIGPGGRDCKYTSASNSSTAEIQQMLNFNQDFDPNSPSIARAVFAGGAVVVNSKPQLTVDYYGLKNVDSDKPSLRVTLLGPSLIPIDNGTQEEVIKLSTKQDVPPKMSFYLSFSKVNIGQLIQGIQIEHFNKNQSCVRIEKIELR